MEQRIIQYVSYLKGIYLKEYDDEERKKICACADWIFSA